MTFWAKYKALCSDVGIAGTEKEPLDDNDGGDGEKLVKKSEAKREKKRKDLRSVIQKSLYNASRC